MELSMKNNIKVYRAMHDLTQESLAERVGVTRQTIHAIEKGKYDPSLELAFKLARLFDTRIEDIFLYGDREPRILK
jgi:putative transcriptional regulator